MAIADRLSASAEHASRAGAVRAGLALTYLTAFTTPLNGFRLGTLAIGDLFLILAIGVLLLAGPTVALPRLPVWAIVFAGSVLAIGVVNQFDPAPTSYLLSRNQLRDAYIIFHYAPPAIVNLTVMVPLLMRITLFPIMFGLARHHRPEALGTALRAFLAATTISALVGFTDSRGLTAIGVRLVGAATYDSRAAGLTQNSNILAMTCVLALPIALWLSRSDRLAERRWALVSIVVVILGLYGTRSRSGEAAAAVAALLPLMLLPRFRRRLPVILFVLALIAAVLVAARPELGRALLRALRFTSGEGAGSDAARSVVNDQAWHDFDYSPLHGIGFSISDQAHIVYLQAAAVGGVILLAGLVIYVLGSITRAARLARTEPMAIALTAALVGSAIANGAQNVLTSSVVYLIPSVVAVMALPGTADHRTDESA